MDKIYEKVKDNKIKKIASKHFPHIESPSLEIIKFVSINDILSNDFDSRPISFMYYRKCLDKVGLYDDKLPVLGDLDFNLRFIVQFDIAFIDEVLAHYHLRPLRKGAAGNSIHTGKIEVYNNLVFNKYIREDFKKGNLDIGSMLMQAIYYNKLKNKMDFYHKKNKFFNRIKVFVKKMIKSLFFRS